jgi:hypothetical protein
MKKSIILLGFGLLATTVFAQDNSLQAGKFFVNGSFGFSLTSGNVETKFGSTTTKTDAPKGTMFNILPSINYMASEKISIGLGIGYMLNSTETTQAGGFDEDGDPITTPGTRTNSTGQFIIAPMANYFIPGGNDKFGFTIGAGVPLAFGTATNEIKSGSTTTKTENSLMGFGVTISPGLYYFPSSKFMLTASMGNLLSWSQNSRKFEAGTDSQTTTNSQFDILNFSTSGLGASGLQIGGSFFF